MTSYDADKDGRLSAGEAPKDAGIHLRKEVPKETPGNYLSMPQVVGLVDGNGDGFATRAEWDATLAFLAANEDNVVAIRTDSAAGPGRSRIVWRSTRGVPEMPSPLYFQGRL
jgi:hypothetical protein